MSRELYIKDDINLIERYNALSYIDNISSEERSLVDDLIKKELLKDCSYVSNIEKINIHKQKLVDVEPRTRNINIDELEDEDKRSNISEYDLISEEIHINEDTNIKDLIRKQSIDIQYRNIHKANLKLLKEYGDYIWEKEIKNLLGYKRYLEKREKMLEKKIKNISIDRKKKQILFRENHLDPLIDDLNRIRNENANLFKIIIQENNKDK